MRKRLIEKFTKAKEGSFGYTMTELLVVVAIIAIVAAIAIPSVIAISRALKFKRVNDHAKSIFLAAQQNLTEMRSDGGLKPLQKAGEEGGVYPITSASFPAEFKTEYVYTTTGTDAFELILPAGSVEATVRAEDIVIEYNPITGNVYAVFYCEEDDQNITSVYSSSDLPRNADGDKSRRKDMMLGYYDGSGLNSSQLELEEVRATVEFVNGEEGIVRVLVPVPDDFFGNLDEYAKAMTINLSVTGEYSMVQAAAGAAEEESGETVQTPGYMFSIPIKVAGTGMDNKTCYVEYGNTIVVEYPIDSLVNYGSFANYSSSTYDGAKNGGTDAKAHLTDLMDETRFTILPGENVTLEAEVKVDTEVKVEVENGILSGVNPMFEYLQPSGTGGYILAVSNGRNLQNLNAIAPTIAKQVDSVVFTSDIYWNDTVSYYNDKYDTKTSAPGYQNEAAENPARALPYFVPIHHEDLFGTAKFIFPGEGDGGLGGIINAILGKLEEIFFGGFYNAQVPTLTDELDAASNVKHADIQGNGHKVYNLNIDSTQYTIPNVGKKGSVLNPENNQYVETDLTGKFYATGENQIIDYCFTGLFGYVNTPIENLHVVNPVIKGHEMTLDETVVQHYWQLGNWMIPTWTETIRLYNNPATGALIGVGGFNTLVTDCSTYIDKDARGYNPNYFYHGDYSKTAVQTWYGVSGEGAVGGLVGYAKSHRNVSGELTNDRAVLAFSKCFAAVPVSGNMRGTDARDFGYSNGVGAFIGNSQITNFYNCYASGDVKATGSCVYQTDIGKLVPSGLEEILMNLFGPSGSATTFPYSGRTSMGAGGFVGSSHGTRYTNCFATGDVVATGDCAGGFVGFMSIDETFAYGNDTKVAQRTVFTNCYAVGSATNGNGRQENFSGGNGRVVFKLDTTMSYFVNDYYRLYAPYYVQYGTEPKYGTNGAMYVFRDSYYRSADPEKAMENTNECALPASYEVLQNLIGSHSLDQNGNPSTWIQARISAIKNIELYETTEQVKNPDDRWWDVTDDYIWVTTKHTYDTEYFIPNDPTLYNLYVSEYVESYNIGNATTRSGWEAATPGTTHSYELETAGAVYPFTKLYGMDYYGNWPSEPAAAGLAYYESYVNDDNTYYYFDRKSTATTTDYPSNIVDMDGYAILSQKSDNISVTIGTQTQSLSAREGGAETFEAGSSVYYIFHLNETLMDEAAKLCKDGPFYVPVTVSQGADTYTMYFNPYIYLSQVNPVYGTKDAVQPDEEDVPKTMYIRSARQFAGISNLSNYWTENYTYIQQFNLDADSYLWDDATTDKQIASIGSSAKPFNATYRSVSDSQFRVKGFQYTDKAAGLFGVIGTSGSVENLTIPCASIDLDSATVSEMGILVGRNEGTISNVDLSITGNVIMKGKTNAGLLVGYSSGIIQDCDIVVAQTSASVSMTATNTGGLVGCVEGTEAKKAIVTNCTLNVSPKITFNGAKNVGGLIGQAKHLNLTATEPLVTMTELTADKAAYAGGLAGWMEDSEIKITDAENAVTVTADSITNSNGTAAGVLGGGKTVTLNSVDVKIGSVSGNVAAGFLGSGTDIDASYCDVEVSGTIQGETKAAGVAGTIGSQSVFEYATVKLGSGVSASAGDAAGYAVEISEEANVQNSSVTMNGTTIKATDGDAAGYACTLAGYVGNTSGSSVLCSVVGKGTITGKNAAGFACEITDQVSGAFVTPALDSSKYLGNSNKNLVVNGTSSAAGFALTVGEDATVTNCYALNQITGASMTGFVGTNKGTITGCMANVTISGGNAFVATNDGTVTRCYGWYGDGDPSKTETNAKVGGKVYSAYFVDLDIPDLFGVVENAPASVVLYDADGRESTTIKSPSVLRTQGIDALTSDKTNYAWIDKSAADEFPYSDELEEEQYDYPMLRAHYGDWVVAPSFAYGVAYYETYTDGSIKIQIDDRSNFDETIEEKSLDACVQIATGKDEEGKDALTVTSAKFDATGDIATAGYAIFCRTGDQNTVFKDLSVGDTAMTIIPTDVLDTPYKGAYSFYELKGDTLLTLVGENGSVAVDLRFANAIADNENAFDTYNVRTPEQLAKIGAVSASFSQTHDIAVEDFEPAKIDAQKTYNGNGLKLSVSGQTKTWMSTVEGTVQNLNLEIPNGVNAPVFGTVSKGANVTLSGLKIGAVGAEGALANVVSGTMTVPAISTPAVNGMLFGDKDGTVSTGTINVTDAITVNGEVATLFGNVANVTVDGAIQTGKVNTQLFGDVSGTVSTGAINVTGTAAQVFGDVTGGSVTVNGGITTAGAAQIFGTVGAEVKVNGLIKTGDLTGNAIDAVNAKMTLNGITVGDVPAGSYVIAGFGNGANEVKTGDVNVTKNIAGNVFGAVNGTVKIGAVKTQAAANIFGNVTGGSLTVASINTYGKAVNGNVFGEINGTVNVGTVDTAGNFTGGPITTGAVSGNVFGTVGAEVSTGAITTGDLTGNVFGAVTAKVTANGITAGTVGNVVASAGTNSDVSTGAIVITSGQVIGPVSGGKVETGTITVDSVTANSIVTSVSGGEVKLGNITINPVVTKDADGNEITTYADVPTLIGEVKVGTVSGANVNLVSAKIPGGIFASVASGTVQNFNVTTTGAVNAPLVGGDQGGNLTNLTVECGSATVEGGILVKSVGQKAAVSGCTVKVTREAKIGGSNAGGLTGSNAGTLSGNTVNIGTLTATSTDATVGGLAGTNSGSISGTTKVTVTTLSGGKTVGGLAGTNSGSISGAEVSATINHTGNGGVTIGGIVGEMTGGSLTDSKASGSINAPENLTNKANAIGGAIGKISAGTVGEDNKTAPTVVTTSVTVDAKWAGATKQTTSDTFGVDSKLNKGPVGMFVGYAAGVTFTNCESTAANETYQFVGEAALGEQTVASDLWSSNVKSDKAALNAYSDTDKLSDTSYKAYAGDVTAEMYSGVTSCKSVSTQFNNCTFYLGKEIRGVTYGAEQYFYQYGAVDQDGYTVGTPSKATYAAANNLSYTVRYRTDDSFAMQDTGLYYKIDENTYGRVQIQLERYQSGQSIIGTARYKYKATLRYFVDAAGNYNDIITESSQLTLTETSTKITVGDDNLYSMTVPAVSAAKYLVANGTNAVNATGTLAFTVGETFDLRKPLGQYVATYDGSTLTLGGNTYAKTFDSQNAQYYDSDKVLLSFNGLSSNGVTKFQMYPLEVKAGAYQLLTFTYQPNAEYQRQFVTSEKVGEVPAALSEEPEIPAGNGGETGNNT